MQGCGQRDDRKDRPRRVCERTDADGCDGKTGDQALRARGIDDGATRHLSDQSDNATDRQHQPNFDLCPFLRRQVDRDEWTEASLDVGEKEDEPVEATLALRRGGWARG